jgi:ribonuclease HI
VVIKTTSMYLINGMESFLTRWKSNGWKNGNEKAIDYEWSWRFLDEMICVLEGIIGVSVSFLWMGKEFNKRATELARDALR